MSFRRRTFPEVLDSLLLEIAGGVAAEEHPFPPPGAVPHRHSLEHPPVAQVVSVYGSRDGQPWRFRDGKDYRLDADQRTLAWLEAAELPDAGTLVQVNYLPTSAQPVLTDLQTGSVVRTLSETLALEVARLYAQLEAVYRAGFVDTAEGASLDQVVALLGVERVRAGRPAGEVQFTRSAAARGAITVPAGTRIMTASGDVEYETTATVTLAPAQAAVRVLARDLEPNEPLPADSLTVLPVPLAGIEKVTNPAPTAVATLDETDGELRERAKNFLHGSERATVGALRQAIARQQVGVEIEEDPDHPGLVWYTLHADALTPELEQRVLAAVEDARPAGVRVLPKGFVPPKAVDLELRLTTTQGLTEQDLRAAHRAVKARIEDYFRRLPAREDASVTRLVGVAMGVPEVQDARLAGAWVEGASVLDTAAGLLTLASVPTVLGELRLSDPALPTAVHLTVTFPQASAPADRTAIQVDLAAALAYWNERNRADLPAGAGTQERAARQVSFGKLLRALTLPGKPAAGLGAYDDAEPGTVALPTAAGVAPYRVVATLTQPTGLARVLASDADVYALSPAERLSLAGAETTVEGSDG